MYQPTPIEIARHGCTEADDALRLSFGAYFRECERVFLERLEELVSQEIAKQIIADGYGIKV